MREQTWWGWKNGMPGTEHATRDAAAQGVQVQMQMLCGVQLHAKDNQMWGRGAAHQDPAQRRLWPA
jgi:hypothetical protein